MAATDVTGQPPQRQATGINHGKSRSLSKNDKACASLPRAPRFLSQSAPCSQLSQKYHISYVDMDY